MIKQVISVARSSKVGSGLIKGAFGALSIASFGIEYTTDRSRFGHNYGNGVSAIKAALCATSFSTTLGFMALEGIYTGANNAYKKQSSYRHMSWSKVNPQNSATMNQMRQLSIQTLSRSANSRSRVMGNEAFYFHR